MLKSKIGIRLGVMPISWIRGRRMDNGNFKQYSCITLEKIAEQ